jgi:hypothetical protein
MAVDLLALFEMSKVAVTIGEDCQVFVTGSNQRFSWPDGTAFRGLPNLDPAGLV